MIPDALPILVVGASPSVFHQFREMFPFGFSFQHARSETEMFDMLRREEFSAVVCEQNLQDTTGEAALANIAKTFPHVSRLIVAHENDIMSALGNLDGVRHQRFIRLPLSPFETRQALEYAADVFYLKQECQKLGNNLEQYYKTLRDSFDERSKQLAQERDNYKRQNAKILDSIRNAERIQRAILPSEAKLDAVIAQYFLIFKPRDIVSGDFYWTHIVKDEDVTRFFIAVADSTGHGVPGAFMSMVGTTLLNQIVGQNPMQQPAEILEQLHDGVQTSLRHASRRLDVDDGIEICLCMVEEQRVTFSGAGRPLYIVAQDENNKWQLNELKGDRKPIGGARRKTDTRFTNHTLEVPKGSMIYLTTDGFADQSNEASERFTSRRLKDKLIEIAGLTCLGQRYLLENELAKYQGSEAQRDDLTILGVRLPILSMASLELPSGSFSVTGNLIL
jgi:serine phosphatase RsbU (regulator of sigma subunit)